MSKSSEEWAERGGIAWRDYHAVCDTNDKLRAENQALREALGYIVGVATAPKGSGFPDPERVLADIAEHARAALSPTP